MRRNRFTHSLIRKVGKIFEHAVLRVKIGLEIACFLHFAVFKGKVMRGRQLVNALEECFLGRGILERKVVRQSLLV